MSTILIVDDSSVDRHLFDGILSKVAEYNIVQAENGVDALCKLKDWNADLVVTDLQMPEMDGLELVKAVRRDFPMVPTILTTGFGSEEIATAALNAGAASYVPKSKVAELLVPTVQGVLEILQTERSYAKLLQKATETKFDFLLDNDFSSFAAILKLCDTQLSVLSPLDKIERLRVEVAIEHALSNALFRGNLEIGSSRAIAIGRENLSADLQELIEERKQRFGDRRIYVCLKITNSDLACLIRDQGPGFASEIRPSINGDSGRGLILMNAFMDEVNFNHAGNEVILRRRWAGTARPPRTRKAAPPASKDEVDELIKPTPAASMNLGVLVKSGTGQVIELLRPNLLVGRGDTCHIVIEHKDVARHHCQLTYKEGFWTFRSVSGDNEVMHNERGATRGTLMPGDRIKLGSQEYQIDYHTDRG